MFPELFGSPYVLPAIIVVVLLLLLLTLILIRRRKRPVVPGEMDGMVAGVAPSGPVDGRVVPAPGPIDTVAPSVPSAPSSTPQPLPPAQSVAQEPIRPAAEPHAEWIPAAMPQFDPLQATVLDIIQGWGELTPEDTNRLDIFRPERVIAAVATAEVPKELKNSEYAHTRLAQLRRYAASIERPSAAPVASPPQPVQPSPTQMPAVAPQPDAVQPVPAAGPEAVEAVRIAAASAPAATLAASAAVVETAAAYEPIVDATPAAVMAPVEVAATEAIPAVELVSSAVSVQADESEAGSPSSQVESPQTAVSTGEVPTPIGPAVPMMGGGLSHGDSLAGLRGTISTAAGVLALPAQDQAEMLAFLEPTELQKVFRTTSDRQLKLAVIDTLESVASPTALKIIHSCLDDPDPDVQLHALDAADRLLDTQ